MEEWDGHLSVGFIGTRYLLGVLSEYGEADVAHHLWNVNTWPSWRWLLENGLDTVNSYWNHFDKPGKLPVARFIQSEKPVAASWVYESLCGLQPDPQYPGWKRIILAPAPPSNMAWAEAELLTVRGRIKFRWVREGGKMTYRFTLPANTQATVLLPHGTPLQGFGPGLKNLGIEEAPIGMVNRIEALAGSYTLYE